MILRESLKVFKENICLTTMTTNTKRHFIVFLSFVLICFVSSIPYTYYVNHFPQSVLHMTKESIDHDCKITKKILQTKAKDNKLFSYVKNMKVSGFATAKSICRDKQYNNKATTKSFEKYASLKNQNCTLKKVTLSEKMLPITGLVSFPGSGNTWIRHLIQQMTGLATSSVYCDIHLRKRGFPHECERNKSLTLVVKTHVRQHFNMFKKIVFLIRSPYDAPLSYSQYILSGHTGHPSETFLINVSNSVFNNSIRRYVNLVKATTTKFKGPVHVIHYETLQTNMSSTLRKLAAFLNINVTDEDVDCTVMLQEGQFHRLMSKCTHDELLHAVYSNQQTLRLKEVAHYSEETLKDAYGISVDLIGINGKLLLQNFI